MTKILAANRIRESIYASESKDVSGRFSFVPNLVNATMTKQGDVVKIEVKTSGTPSKAMQLRISRAVFYAANAVGRRVRELSSTTKQGQWTSEFRLELK